MSLSHPHPEPQPYPLMLRTWVYRPWQPLLGVLLLLVGFFLVPFLFIPVLALALVIDGQTPLGPAMTDALTLDKVTWPALLFLNLALAALVPLTWGLVRWLHRLRPRWVASVRPGFRWRFFWVCFGLAVLAILAQFVVGAFLPSGAGDPTGGTHESLPRGQLIGLALVVLFTTPLQAMGEEYAFRGYALQAIGALTRRSWAAVLGSALIFALAHGAQNLPLFLDRFTFGLMAGYVVFRTGGLEAGIALHVWNNLVAFGLALGFGSIQESLTTTTVSWWNIPLTITMNGVYMLLVLTAANRMGLSRLSTPPPGGEGPDPRPVLEPTTPAV